MVVSENNIPGSLLKNIYIFIVSKFWFFLFCEEGGVWFKRILKKEVLLRIDVNLRVFFFYFLEKSLGLPEEPIVIMSSMCLTLLDYSFRISSTQVTGFSVQLVGITCDL